MADNQLDILIRILTQEVGAEKADQVLKKVTDETKKLKVEQVDLSKTQEELTANVVKADAATQKYNLSKKQLKDLAQGLKQEFPLLGTAVKFFTNPLTVSVGLLSACVAGFIDLRRRAIALATDVDFRPMAADVKGLADAASLAKDGFDSLGQSMASTDNQAETTTEIIKAQAKAAEELAEALGDTDEAKAKRERATRDRLLEEDKKLLEQKKRTSDALIDEHTAAAKELISAETAKNQADAKLRDITANIAALEAKQKAGGIRPDELDTLFRLRRLQGGAEINAAAAGERLTRAGAGVTEATGRINASDREISTLRGSIASRSRIAAAGDEASGRAAAVGGAVSGFFDRGGVLTGAGGRTPANMASELQTVISELTASKIAFSQLIMILTNIFKDGVVSKPELDALKKALSDHRRT